MQQERSSAQVNEQEIQFKKRARRRLVGAIALVLLMVTVLPMVLDDRAAKAPQPEIAISIPSQDGTEFTSKIVPISPETKLSETAPAVPQSKPEPAVSAESTKDSTKPVDRPADTGTGSSAPLASPPVKPADKSSGPAATSTTRTTETESTPHAAVEKTAPEPNSGSTNGLSVQIGVFSDAANVKQLQQKLLAQGFQSYTEKLNTAKGEKIRLRAGPFASRADAENALARIKDSGLSGMIVNNK